MAALTNKQRSTLSDALYHLRRAQKYIQAPTTALAYRRIGKPSNTLDFSCPDCNVVLSEVNKEYGSDITGLQDGIKILERLLAGPTVEREEVSAMHAG